MLFISILAQSSNDDGSTRSALIAFLVVMAIVIGAIALVRSRSRRGTDPTALDQQAEQDDVKRQLSFDEKMRRVEERLRQSEADGENQPPEEPSEP